jgi:hypothetical protein
LVNSKNHSIVKSIRLSNELNDYLTTEAKKSNISVSALASTIFTSYRDRYSFVDKLQPVALLPTTVTMFVECISDEDLSKLGPNIASKLLTYTKHILDKDNPQGRVNFCLECLMPSSHWFNCYNSKEGYMITHNMGEKWTLFLSSVLSSLVELEIGKKPSLRLDGNIIVLNLPKV